MSTITTFQNQTTYTLYTYSEHTHEELAEACLHRGLGSAGYKHDLLRRLITDDLGEMWKILVRKQWDPACPLFLRGEAQIQEARYQGAFQFYEANAEYLNARMEDKFDVRRRRRNA